MAKQKLRNIVVDGTVYRWSFRPTYQLMNPALLTYRCRDIFTAYAESNYTSPLRIIFITWEDAIVGGPLRYGGNMILEDPNTGEINLHMPRWAAILIRIGLKQGWQATVRSTPFEIGGIDLLLTELIQI